MTMILSVVAVAALGLALGWLLGLASQWLGATTDPVLERITEALPGSQCGQCGFAGCAQAVAAVGAGDAPVTLCPPGGRAVAEKLAQILGATFDPGNLPDRGPLLARVRTDACIGCSRCIKSCPTDAILGATKAPRGPRRGLHRLWRLRRGLPHRRHRSRGHPGHPAQLALAQAGRGTRLNARRKHTGTPRTMKIFRFRGGIHPEGNKDPTACHPIARLPLPQRLYIPLQQHIGEPAAPEVNKLQ